MAKSDFDALLRELPHVLVLIILILVLLVVLTKFQVVHCSQIPGNWCEIYCTQIMRSKSTVALISGDEGIGDPRSLKNLLEKTRVYTPVTPIQASALTQGTLKNFDLVIIERAKRMSTLQVRAIEDFVNRGGTLILIGDAASEQYVDRYDLLWAAGQNTSFYQDLVLRGVTPESQEWKDAWKSVEYSEWYDYLLRANTTRIGFGRLSSVVAAEFDRTENVSGNVTLDGVFLNHMVYRGIVGEYPIDINNFAVVTMNPSAVTLIAMLNKDGKDYPAIFETKYAGRILYFAFPLEAANSSTLVTNVVDYLIPC